MDIFFKIWAVAGPLIGVVLGGYLSRMWQREQWVLDNKKQEYRELMTALTRTYGLFAQYKAPMVAIDAQTQRMLDEADAEALLILRDRLFIRKEIEDANVQSMWVGAVIAYDRTLDLSTFTHAFNNISDVLTTLANHTFKLPFSSWITSSRE